MLPKTAWGSKSVIAVMSAARPLFHQEQTFVGTHRTAVSCQEATYASQQTAPLFDHLVGAADQRQRKSEAKRLGRLEIDHELDFHSQLNREIARLFTLENPARVNAGQTISVGHVATIAHQAAGSCELVRKVHRRHRVARGKRDELVALFVEDRIGGKGQRGDPPLDEMRKRSVDVVVAARVLDNYLQAQRASCCLHVTRLGFGSRVFWVDEEANHGGVWHQLV